MSLWFILLLIIVHSQNKSYPKETNSPDTMSSLRPSERSHVWTNRIRMANFVSWDMKGGQFGLLTFGDSYSRQK